MSVTLCLVLIVAGCEASSLRTAASNGRLEDVKVIIIEQEHGQRTGMGKEAAIFAARSGHWHIVRWTLENYPGIIKDYYTSFLLLSSAVSLGHWDSIKMLINSGGLRSYSDSTLIDTATNNGHLEVAKFLSSLLTTTVTCNQERMVVTGYYVHLRDIIKLCPNLTQLVIFACDTVFIDTDLAQAGLNLAIVAPRWHVLGHRKLVLDGAPGRHQTKGTSGQNPGTPGHNGQAGLPGRPAGNMLGIGVDFVDSQLLTITANGGRGGRGQDGGDGAKGQDGVTDLNTKCIVDPVHLTGVRKEVIESKCWFLWGCTVQYGFTGSDGQIGGNGGDGGRGGKGGYPGQINIVGLGTEYPEITVRAESGAEGGPGRGGLGGIGGLNGDMVEGRLTVRLWLSPWRDMRFGQRHPRGRARSGRRGNPRYNMEVKQPEKPLPLITAEVINTYTGQLVQHLDDTTWKTCPNFTLV